MLKESGFFKLINITLIIDQSFADASSSNITKQSLLKPLVCQEFVFLIGRGDKEVKIWNLQYTVFYRV